MNNEELEQQITRLRTLEEIAHVYSFDNIEVGIGEYHWNKYLELKDEIQTKYNVAINETNWSY